MALLAPPAAAQTSQDYLVRFTGFLGDLRLFQPDLRAGLSGETDETAQVAIAMNEEATAAFALFTRTHVNQSVTFTVCGQAFENIAVQAPIETGFAITQAMPLERAQEMVDALNGLGDCPE